MLLLLRFAAFHDIRVIYQILPDFDTTLMPIRCLPRHATLHCFHAADAMHCRDDIYTLMPMPCRYLIFSDGAITLPPRALLRYASLPLRLMMPLPPPDGCYADIFFFCLPLIAFAARFDYAMMIQLPFHFHALPRFIRFARYYAAKYFRRFRLRYCHLMPRFAASYAYYYCFRYRYV